MSTPRVGELATVQTGSDRRPYTVVAVSPTGVRLTLQARAYRRADDGANPERQAWLTWEEPSGEIVLAHRGGDGRYRVRGRFLVTLGVADVYLDPSF